MKHLTARSLVVLVLLACGETPTQMQGDPPLLAIVDGAHNRGNAFFFFLPPLVPPPTTSGIFDPALEPIVDICEVSQCATSTIATFTTSSGPGSETVRVGNDHYIVNWHTDEFGLDPAKTYRIRVHVAGTQLGYADVDVVSNGSELRNVDTGEFIGLMNGRTLPIKFRIEEGAVVVALIEVTPPAVAIAPEDNVQVAAVLKNAAGDLITGAVSWSSGNEAIATVDAAGLVTAVAAGTAVVSATSGTVMGEAEITVSNAVAAIVIGETSPTALVGDVLQLTVTMFDAAGTPLTDREPLWESDAPSVLTVDQTGLVTPQGLGAATVSVTVTREFVSEMVVVTIEPAVIALATSNGEGLDEIYTIKTDGTDLTRLTFLQASASAPDWSHDGTRITFSAQGGDGDGRRDIFVMDVDGSNLVNLTPGSETHDAPTWSPDGSRIAFQFGGGSDAEIYVMDADGSNVVNLTNSPGQDTGPDWSPDGTKIVFGSARVGGHQIWVMNADGTAPTRLANDPGLSDRFPQWSPDGLRIAFARSFGREKSDIYVMAANGTGLTRLTDHPAGDFGPTWSTGSTKIAFFDGGIRLRADNAEIYVVNADGSGAVTRLTNRVFPDRAPSWKWASP